MLGHDVLRGQRFTVLSVLTNWPVQTIPILILGSPSYGCSSSPSIPGCHFCVYGYPQYTLYLLLVFGCGLDKQRKLSLAGLLTRFSRVRLCVTPQTTAQQDSPSLGFSRQEHWSAQVCSASRGPGQPLPAAREGLGLRGGCKNRAETGFPSSGCGWRRNYVQSVSFLGLKTAVHAY